MKRDYKPSFGALFSLMVQGVAMEKPELGPLEVYDEAAKRLKKGEGEEDADADQRA